MSVCRKEANGLQELVRIVNEIEQGGGKVLWDSVRCYTRSNNAYGSYQIAYDNNPDGIEMRSTQVEKQVDKLTTSTEKVVKKGDGKGNWASIEKAIKELKSKKDLMSEDDFKVAERKFKDWLSDVALEEFQTEIDKRKSPDNMIKQLKEKAKPKGY